MRQHDSNSNSWQGFLPQGKAAILSLVIVAILAFVLGGLLMNGSESSDSAGDHSHSEATGSAEPEMWTCSMHPQIQLPKPGKCPICFMDLIPVETGGGSELDPNQIQMSATAVQLAGIQTTPVVRAHAEREIRMVGKLDYDETNVSYITAWVPGRIDSLFVDFTGATVAKGDPMVELYSPELVATQEELLQAKKATMSLSASSSSVLKSTAEETLRSSREKLRLFGLSDKQIAEIEAGNEISEHLIITAPASGVVVHKDAREGMYVATGTRIYTIADLGKLWVKVEAYESDLPWLKEAQPVTFTSPSFPGETFDAVITFIDPVVDPKTRTVEIRAEVKNKSRRLKPEMFVSATVHSRLDSEGLASGRRGSEAPLLIPASAPLITGKRAVVYLQVPSEEGIVFEGREITLGPRAGDFYVVEDGLNEGEEVVTNGAFKIDSELQIQAKPSMMSPPDMTEPLKQHDEATHGSELVEKTQDGPYQAGTAKRIEIGAEALAELSPVYGAYFDVQMALAKDDIDATTSGYQAIAEAISAVNMGHFEGEAHMRWMAIADALTRAAKRGASSSSIDDARDSFFRLSLAAIELHDTFGHADDKSFYLTYCPMARNNAGAYWLQTENIVWNSFYGAAMLRCGEIKQELPSGAGEAEQ